jgi:hypothetical protein
MMALELLDTKWAGDGSQQAGKHFGDRCLVVAVVCRPPRDRVGTVYTRYGRYFRAPVASALLEPCSALASANGWLVGGLVSCCG